MQDWAEIRAWRRATRAEILARRLRVPRAEKTRTRSTLGERIGSEFPELRHACVGFYWPIKGEIDLRHLVRELLAAGAEAALPVVVEKQQPLEFRAWSPRTKLERGFWNIPVPSESVVVRPTALLVPLVGFDAAGYRLGYGGGYYDRTLATMNPKPLTIGVGYDLGRLATIYPQPHDIPLDILVTESGVRRLRYRGAPLAQAETPPTTPYASSPCLMHELEPESLGFLGTAELIALLNVLIESERAGARAVAAMASEVEDLRTRTVLREIAMDEARFCAMLSRHAARLGGSPSRDTGSFHDKLIALEAFTDRLALLDRGQAWVVGKIRQALPRIADDGLQEDLREMIDAHISNSGRCAELQ